MNTNETTQYRLKDILVIGNGKDHSSLDDGEYPVLGSGGIMRYANSYLYDGESVLLPRKGTLNNIQFIKGKFWTVDTCYYTKINNTIVNPYYLYRYLRSLDLSSLDSGASIPSMTSKCYYGIKIRIPNVCIQQKIANILSRYDEAIENNSKRIKLLEQMAQNLYKEWFVRFRFPGWQNVEFENGMPKGWKVEKLGNLFKRLPFGKTYKKEDLEENGKIIVIDQSTDDYLGFHNEEPSHKATFDSPLILFGDHSCKFVLMTKDFSLGENIIPISSCNINPYYLFRAIDGIIETTEYKRHWSMLITQKILIPIDSLQTRFSKIYKSFIKQIENLKNANQNLAKQRDLLLPRLMSGKLEV